MKALLILVPLVASCWAGEASYNPAAGTQRGLLVLPKPAPAGPTYVSQNQGYYPTKNNYNQQPQTPEILRPEFAERRGVYFVEVPEERIQALRGYSQQQTSQYFQPSTSAQYNNQQESFADKVRFLPLEDTPAQAQTTFPQYSQYQQEPSYEAVVRYLPVPLTGEDQY